MTRPSGKKDRRPVAAEAGHAQAAPCSAPVESEQLASEPGAVPVMHLVELEYVRRHLTQALAGCTVQVVEACAGLTCSVPLAELRERLTGAVVQRVDRRGRQLYVRAGEEILGVTVRPGAAVSVGSPPALLPHRLLLTLGFGLVRIWVFGHRGALSVTLVKAGNDVLPRTGRTGGEATVPDQGLEPLSAAFTLRAFKRILRNKKRTIFQLLVDDELIAGVGDLYADEVLFVARLRPTRAVPSLGEDEIQCLYYSILEVLQKAIRFGGVGAEGVALVEGRSGTFSRFLAVHGRESHECPTCRTRIRSLASGEMRTSFCPRCQK